MAAMRSGAADTDDYLAEWRRGEATDVDSISDEHVEQLASQIETEYDRDRINTLINNGGFAS